MTEKQLAAGDKAPAFKLLNQDGVEVDSSKISGKVIVYFYPAASTPGCTKQACDFRDNLGSLKKLGFTVLGVSPDKPAKLKKFVEKEGLNFELLSDESTNVQQAFGVWGKKSMYGKEYMGTIRSTFVIENGKVLNAFYNVKAAGHVEFLRGELGL